MRATRRRGPILGSHARERQRPPPCREVRNITIAATSIDVNVTIPAGSFDVPIVTASPAPTEGLLASKSPGVPDAQSAAIAIEKCRADTHGALPPPIRATKGPKIILRCGARTETFAVTPGNSVEFQPQGDQYLPLPLVGLTRFDGHPRSGACPREDVHRGGCGA